MKTDPTRIDAGMSKALLEQMRQSREADAAAKLLRIEVAYDFRTGNCQLKGAPDDPIVFFGVMQVAADTYRVLLAQLRSRQAATAKEQVPQ